MADKLTEVQTKLRIRTQQAQAAEQRKNDLVVYLAHDIKTPLTSVIGYLSLLNEDKSLSREQMARYIRIALEKAYRLETLINEFFEITRYRFQSVPLQLEDVDLCYMMVQISDELYPKLMERGKTMELEVPEDLHIRADSDKMARVFNNILKNAIAYSEPASPIRVSAHAEPGRVLIRFTNRGAIPHATGWMTSLKNFTAWMPPGVPPPAGPGWAWPSPGILYASTAAKSPPEATARTPFSPWCCPSPRAINPKRSESPWDNVTATPPAAHSRSGGATRCAIY